MHRRPIIHVFLAFLLLFTQQLGATHVYSHWTDTTQSKTALTGAEEAEHRKRLAVHKVCAECVSVAHMAAAVTSQPMTIAIVAVGSGVIATPSTLSSCERTVCVFQSRAPPSGLTPEIRFEFCVTLVRPCRSKVRPVMFFC